MSNKMAPDLGKLDELAKVHALSYASPHHFTMSVNGLREVIAELQLPAGNKMALDALTEPKAVSLTDVLQAAAPAEIADALAPVVQAVQAGEYPPLPEGVKARFKCEDCDGTGYTGEMIPGSEFQPPEPVGCTSCRFTGWWAECEAYSADQMHAYLDADRASSCAAQAAPFAKDSWQHAVDNQLVAFGRTSQEFANPHEALAWLAIVNMELGQSNVGAAQAVRMLTEVRFCYESMKPIEDFDAIYAEYATTFCRYPDDFMAKVVRQTKEDLFMWWGAHREKIRAGLVLLAAQEDANRTIPADGKIGGAA